MISAIIAFVFAYTLTSLLGYIIHWAIHKRWAGKLYRSHLSHHVDLYPAKDLESDVYRSAGHMSTVYTFVMAFVPLMILPFVFALLSVISWSSAVSVIVGMIIVGILNDVLHDSYHVRGHWLSRFVPRYELLKHRHFIHHKRMKTNFGIYEFTWDRIFKTFRDV